MNTELIAIEPTTAPATLFGSDNPEYIIARATSIANALAKVVKDKKLASFISGREYVRIEGWTLLGTMLGVFPICTWVRKLDDGWEARVEARTLAGQLVGAAEAQCCRDEQTWSKRSEYALRSMAQTRATSKALRLPLGFVMSMAGYDPTPAEEIPEEEPRQESRQRPSAQRQQPIEGEVVRTPEAPRRNMWDVFQEMGYSREEATNESQILFDGREPQQLQPDEKRMLTNHLAEIKKPEPVQAGLPA